MGGAPQRCCRAEHAVAHKLRHCGVVQGNCPPDNEKNPRERMKGFRQPSGQPLRQTQPRSLHGSLPARLLGPQVQPPNVGADGGSHFSHHGPPKNLPKVSLAVFIIFQACSLFRQRWPSRAVTRSYPAHVWQPVSIPPLEHVELGVLVSPVGPR